MKRKRFVIDGGHRLNVFETAEKYGVPLPEISQITESMFGKRSRARGLPKKSGAVMYRATLRSAKAVKPVHKSKMATTRSLKRS